MLARSAFAYTISNPSKFGTVGDVISSVIPNIYYVAGLIFFFLLVFGGVSYMMAGGDDKAIGKAKNTITAAVIGLAIVLLSGFVVRVLETVFGVAIFG
ncbi:hypothetical protein COT49_01630 [candidate division WWE3 bacterium CG08_land_8_20_14_0_20_40_13]|uniref:Uncharacterized protein n=1 Tax=candidate division WWE3 bacterium CG08_land_8_20_14_0_20_40_13 TaxID=1975084 RepID=A0A2H0XE59_UNCKA|nr:MAG: hypothetical protein COT49_01630 [candidate division WWE3 bacterium CG08_land_8_20_14_0_20_40_13]